MALMRRGRLIYLIAKELSHKYTKALALGFVSGFMLSLAFWRMFPVIQQQWLVPTERIGMIGEFTPTTLPLSIQHYISSGLTMIGEDGQPQPALATSWEATDSAKTFVFHLRTDARWSNGKLVVASDVNYNIQDVVTTASDPHTLRMELKTPFGYSPFPSVVAKPLVLPGLVGFGDYRVGRITLNGDVVHYLKLLPKASGKKSREYRFYQTEQQAVMAYKVGDIDTIEDVTDDFNLNQWGKTVIHKGANYTRIVSIFFNLSQDLLKEKAFRQALAYGVPDLPYERSLSPIPKTNWAYTDKVKRYTYTPDQVKKLLKTAKVDKLDKPLVITTFSQYVDTAEAIAKSWEGLGISTTVKVENTVPSDYQILVSAQDVPPDPDQYPFWHSTQTAKNITHYANVKIDKLLEDARRTTDTEERKKLYADFARHIVEDAPVIFLYYAPTYTIVRQ